MGDQPFAIGSHRSCSFTSNSYASPWACGSCGSLSMCSEVPGDCAAGSTSVSFGGEADIMYLATCSGQRLLRRNSLVVSLACGVSDHVTVGSGPG